MSENIYGYDPARSDAAPRIAFPALMQKVYTWMTLALAITALTAYVTMQNEGLFYAIFSSKLTMWGLFGGELLLVTVLSSEIHRLSFPVAGLLFALYSMLNGMMFSAILFLYTSESIATTFLVTAGTWTWDAKETWAAACWCACLVYVHLRRPALQHPATATHAKAYVHPYAWVIIAFALLQMCWYGVSFLPSAAASMHNYAY